LVKPPELINLAFAFPKVSTPERTINFKLWFPVEFVRKEFTLVKVSIPPKTNLWK